MEFGERKRRRKSPSFKLVADEDCEPPAQDSSEEPGEDDVWLGEDGMEIKKQITGMMRLLTDKTGRVYQRVEVEHGQPSPEDKPTACPQPALKNLIVNNWNATACAGSSSAHISNLTPCDAKQYGTRSVVSKWNYKDERAGDVNVAPCNVQENSCCTCNCKGTLNSILYELRAMRRLMQTQRASLDAHEPTAPLCHTRFSPGHSTRRRRRQFHKVTPGFMSSPEAATVLTERAECVSKEEFELPNVGAISEVSASTPTVDPASANSHNSLLPRMKEPLATGVLQSPEVRLAEDYDVFISKAQLDSILVNYTRSGSLLFRKLVCAFFNDATLANSLPNGKRKRGLNDNRKGLDQNIVGAIKGKQIFCRIFFAFTDMRLCPVFTEKYCTEHKIDKLPGPRDWVQILQDQIKLARRRLRRDAAETDDPASGP
ncbi:BEN domain-containing protein 7 isoform 1-T1 [Synchiropus picturatus]